jgi:hypothetical protein
MDAVGVDAFVDVHGLPVYMQSSSSAELLPQRLCVFMLA